MGCIYDISIKISLDFHQNFSRKNQKFFSINLRITTHCKSFTNLIRKINKKQFEKTSCGLQKTHNPNVFQERKKNPKINENSAVRDIFITKRQPLSTQINSGNEKQKNNFSFCLSPPPSSHKFFISISIWNWKKCYFFLHSFFVFYIIKCSLI